VKKEESSRLRGEKLGDDLPGLIDEETEKKRATAAQTRTLRLPSSRKVRIHPERMPEDRTNLGGRERKAHTRRTSRGGKTLRSKIKGDFIRRRAQLLYTKKP